MWAIARVQEYVCVPEPASLGVPLCDNSGWQAHTSGTRLLHEKAPRLVGPRVAWRAQGLCPCHHSHVFQEAHSPNSYVRSYFFTHQ